MTHKETLALPEPSEAPVEAVKVDKLQNISDDITSRSRAILDKNYSVQHLMSDLFIDFKNLGNKQDLLQFVATGKVSPAQLQRVERIAVKVLAVITKVK